MNSNALTSEQLQQLVGFDLCHLHDHPKQPYGLVDIAGLSAAAPIRTVTDTVYTVGPRDFIIQVDATTGPKTVQLPPAAKGREYHVLKVAGSFPVIVSAAGSETIIGHDGVSFTGLYTSLHIKAIEGTGYILL